MRSWQNEKSLYHNHKRNQRRTNLGVWLGLGVWLTFMLGWLTCVIVVVWVIAHFILKFW